MEVKTSSSKTLFTFIFLILFLFFPLNFGFGEEAVKVVINEIAWMGTEASSSDEWIELYNPTDKEIDLTGWKLEGPGKKGIELKGSISANGYFLLERTDDNTVPGIKADQIYTGSLSNSGEKLRLIDEKEKEIDVVDCSKGWFAGNKESRQTMERINPFLSGNDENNWADSKNPGGTPRAKNSQFSTESPLPLSADAGSDVISLVGKEITFDGSGSTGEIKEYLWNFGDGTTTKGKIVTHSYNFPGEYYVSLKVSNDKTKSTDLIKVTIFSSSIFISEFLPNPEGEDSGKEWIEIVNTSERIEDISHWGISTDREEITFVFPEGSYISPRGFLLLPSSVTNISLSNNGGSVFLFYPSGDIAQEIKYDKIEQGYSIARKTKDYFYTKTPTPGMENIISGNSEVKEETSSVSPQGQDKKSSEKITRERKEVKKPASPRKFLTRNLLAEAKANKEVLALSALGVSIFSGFLALGLVKLRRGIKSRSNGKKETIEIEIEK